jgi:uncharacterized membrane protein
MKYTVSVTIDQPRDRVIELFDNTENLYKWQSTLESFKVLEGEIGQDGLKSELTYNQGKKKQVMIETIERFNFPDEMIAIYEAPNVWNRCVNKFYDKGNQTIWEMETEFVMSSWMKLFDVFGKKMFFNQTLSDMNKFKMFAETKQT